MARAAVPWNDVRIHLSTQFLNVDEASALRDEIEQLRQSAYEPEVSYSRRYREVADVAYPEALRNADQERILVKSRIIVSSHGMQACGGHQPNHIECSHYCSSTA